MATATKAKPIELTAEQRKFLRSCTNGRYEAPDLGWQRGVAELVRRGVLVYDGIWGSVHHWRLTEAGRAALKGGRPATTLKGSKQAAGGRSAPMAKKRRKLTAVERRTLAGRFAIHLRSLMDAKDWEVGDLHEQLKRLEVRVEKPAIHAWLRGEALPKARDLEKLGNALGLKDYREVLPPPG